MDEYVQPSGTIDPEVRAHVYSLVTALGGASASDDGRYVLGDDALACLKDIKRWLKLHDEKLNRLDVTRCLAEANLVKGDLLEILGQWPEEAMNEKWRGRMALACVELLVPLTWPVEKDLMSEVTRNQHRHLPYIQVAQVTYKREILEHPSGDLLKKAVRLALPSMAVPGHERTPRDEGIIRLVTYFIRNLAMISATANLPVEWNEQEVSRSATVRAFGQQGVLTMILSMASNVATDFKTQDVVILEVLYHIIKGVDPKKLFMSKPQRAEAASSELKDLMQKEGDLLKTFTKHAPTRHNRFGTMVWIERDESKRSMVSGQDILRNGQATLDKMDKSKKWNKPVRRPQNDRTHMNFDLPETLADDANKALRDFVEDFIDSGFNPLFSHLRKAIEREADRVLIAHAQQFWYLISWFLRAESERRKAKKQAHEQQHGKTKPLELDSFGIVASVLNQETFVLLNRFMQTQLDNKEWQELDAGMRCFTQILLTVQEMAESPLDEDQEIADNIQNNIFYEETTHDRVLAILRGYKDQNFSYLDATTELSHVFLRMLERYSKENGDLQIRSRRKARKRKTKDGQTTGEGQGDENLDQGSEAEDEEQAAKVSRERKFEFNRFAMKFTTQNSVNTYVRFLGYYKDLSLDQLKRAHRFLYRVAFKQEMTVLLFRLDIIQLLNRMIKSSDALNRSHPMFGEYNELVKQIFRKLVKKLKERPELAVELLFSKIPATLHYLEYGYEKQTISVPRAPAELEVRGSLPIDDQIGVVVAALIGEGKQDTVEWLSKTLRNAAGERQAWEDFAAARAVESQPSDTQNPVEPSSVSSEQAAAAATDAVDEANTNSETNPSDPSAPVPSVENPADIPNDAPEITIKPDSAARKLSLFKDARLRLLLKLSGALRNGFKDDVDAPWTVPSSLTSSQLFETASTIEQHKTNPRATYGELEENPLSAADMLKRVAAARPTRITGMFGPDDDEGLDDFLDDGPGAGRSAGDALEELKATRRRRRRNTSEEPDEETLANRRLARRMKELEKRRRIKSTEFVHESDEDSDEERDAAFFAKEREIGAKRARDHDVQFEEAKRKALGGGKDKRKRKRLGDDDGEESDGASRERAKKLRSSDDEEEDAQMSDGGSTSGSSSEPSDDEGLFVSSKKRKGSRRGRAVASSPKRQSKAPVDVDSDSDAGSSVPGADAVGEPDSDMEDTPMSSQSDPAVEKLVLAETHGNRGAQGEKGADAVSAKVREIAAADGASEDDEDDAAPTQRRRVRMAVLDDSDDE